MPLPQQLGQREIKGFSDRLKKCPDCCSVQEVAETLAITLTPLPAYSLDFMPVEHLWQWLREDITDHTYYDQKADLIAQIERFQAQINTDPVALADHLWVKSHLDSKEEKLRIST